MEEESKQRAMKQRGKERGAKMRKAHGTRVGERKRTRRYREKRRQERYREGRRQRTAQLRTKKQEKETLSEPQRMTPNGNIKLGTQVGPHNDDLDRLSSRARAK